MTIKKEVSYDDLRNLILLNQFYQNYSILNNPKEINDAINKVLDHHYTKIYGKDFNNKEIVKTQFQVITKYED